MDNLESLRSLVGTMLMLPTEEIEAGTSLKTLDSSLGSAKLTLGLKRLGLSSGITHPPATFGDLQKLVFADNQNSPAPTVSDVQTQHLSKLSATVSDPLRVGIDVQELAAMPDALDYWDHSFYQGSFSRIELAYATVQSDPKVHFAGFWSAKEALRKCDPRFMEVGLTSLAVVHDQFGAPYFLHLQDSGGVPLPHALSISHSGAFASAIVARSTTALPVHPSTSPALADTETVVKSAKIVNNGRKHISGRSFALFTIILITCLAGVVFFLKIN